MPFAFRRAIVVALPLAAAACGGAADGEAPPAATPAITVALAPVADSAVAAPVTGTGALAASEEATLSFKIGGIVARLAARDGARVAAGQVLATLDLREIDAQVAKARAGVVKAERDLARAQALYRDSVATLAQVQDAETGVQVAKSDLQVAEVNRQYATITAPAAGTVLRTFVDAGELVAPGARVIAFGAAGGAPLVKVGVPDRDVVRVQVGDPATLRFDALPGETFRGRVLRVAGGADPMTGTYLVEIAVDAGARLTSGMVAQVAIAPRRTAPARLVPVEAIVEADGDRAVVYTVASGGATAERRAVTIGALVGDRVPVVGGLDGVTRVVTTGAAYLRDGAAVRVQP
jgi:RND family efflux transporter MFP subunit